MNIKERRPRRRGNLVETSEVLENLLRGGVLSQGFTRWKLWKDWNTVVGKTMAAHSDPVGYNKGVLYVWVSDSVRMQEMVYVVRELITTVNRHVGRHWVRSIRFTLDRKNVPEKGRANKSLKKYLEGK